MQGDTSAEVTVEVNTDTDNETTLQNFIVSVAVDSESATLVQEGSQSRLNFTIPAEAPLPTVSLNYSGVTTVPGFSFYRMAIELSEPASGDVTVNLVGTGTATYNPVLTTGTWQIAHKAVPEGMPRTPNYVNLGETVCNSVTMANPCQITISEEQTIVDAQIYFEHVPSGRAVTLTLGVDSTNVVRGSSFTHTWTIQ